MRLNDWMLRLEKLVQERQRARFTWGEHDCSMWACDAVQAVTGRDPAADLRGLYASEAEANALIEAGGGLGAMACARFGAEIAPALAAAGDIGLISTPRGDALVVCVGGHWLAAAPFGLTVIPAASVLRTWRCEVN